VVSKTRAYLRGVVSLNQDILTMLRTHRNQAARGINNTETEKERKFSQDLDLNFYVEEGVILWSSTMKKRSTFFFFFGDG
jgi:hypothetical protein